MHHALNDYYGESLEGAALDEIFTDAQRTKLKPDALNLIKEYFIKVVQQNATATPEKRMGRIATIVRSLPMVCTCSARNVTLSRVGRLEAAFKRMREDGRSVVFIEIATNSLRYKRDDFQANNFDHIGTSEDAPSQGTKQSNTGNGQHGSPPQDYQDFYQKMQDLMTGASPGDANEESRRTQSQSGRASAHSFDEKNYNLDSLPDVVSERVTIKRDKTRLMVKSEMVPFELGDNESTEDESESGLKRCVSYFVPPNKVIMRDGTFFRLHAEKIPDKRFSTQVPELADKNTSPENVRIWYQAFTMYCKGYGIFVCPYYCFRRGADLYDEWGFTCGEDDENTLYDLPLRFDPALRTWTNWIYNAIRDVFPEGSDEREKCRLYEPDGYAILYAIIHPNHPEFHRDSVTLTQTPPRQSRHTSLVRHYRMYRDFLQLRAYTENNPKNLHNYEQMTCFIASCRWGDQLMKKIRFERESGSEETKRKFTPGNIVKALTTELLDVDETKPPFPNKAKKTGTHGKTAFKEKTYLGGQRRSTTPKKSEAKRNAPRRSANKVEEYVNLIDWFANQMPEVKTKEDQYLAGLYRVGTQVLREGGDFDVTRRCMVCNKTGHTFEQCEVLNNHELLKSFHIQFCSLCRKIGKKTEMANPSRVHRVECEDNETSSSSDDSSDDEIEQGWVGRESDFQ